MGPLIFDSVGNGVDCPQQWTYRRIVFLYDSHVAWVFAVIAVVILGDGHDRG
jgi:hypothetical protein